MSQLFIVVAPLPRVPLLTIDQLLVAGEVYGMRPVLVLNKSDLGDEARRLHQDLAFYSRIDTDSSTKRGGRYRLLCVSALTGEGLAELKLELRGRQGPSIFIGQSGVGGIQSSPSISTITSCLLAHLLLPHFMSYDW